MVMTLPAEESYYRFMTAGKWRHSMCMNVFGNTGRDERPAISRICEADAKHPQLLEHGRAILNSVCLLDWLLGLLGRFTELDILGKGERKRKSSTSIYGP
jgi:hypothetical protein